MFHFIHKDKFRGDLYLTAKLGFSTDVSDAGIFRLIKLNNTTISSGDDISIAVDDGYLSLDEDGRLSVQGVTYTTYEISSESSDSLDVKPVESIGGEDIGVENTNIDGENLTQTDPKTEGMENQVTEINKEPRPIKIGEAIKLRVDKSTGHGLVYVHDSEGGSIKIDDLDLHSPHNTVFYIANAVAPIQIGSQEIKKVAAQYVKHNKNTILILVLFIVLIVLTALANVVTNK